MWAKRFQMEDKFNRFALHRASWFYTLHCCRVPFPSNKWTQKKIVGWLFEKDSKLVVS